MDPYNSNERNPDDLKQKQIPFISVIIPVRNRANTISYCLNSVLKQTYQNFEIIIVDDNSNDTTLSKIQNFNDDRIKVIKLSTHKGAQFARNEGIKSAKYDWIAFLDSDDYWLPNKLEIQVSALKAEGYNEYTVIHGNCYIKSANSDSLKEWVLPHTESDDAYKLLLKRPAPVFPSILTSKKALARIELLDLEVPSYQEWDTSIRLALFCKFIHLNNFLFVYVLHSDESISKDMNKDFLGYLYIISKFKQEILDKLGEECYRKHLSIIFQKFIHNTLYKYTDLSPYAHKMFVEIDTYGVSIHGNNQRKEKGKSFIAKIQELSPTILNFVKTIVRLIRLFMKRS